MFRLVRRVSLAVLLTPIFTVAAAGQAASTSGKLAVGGDSAGAIGILRVIVDPTIDGPLIVTVKNSSAVVVPQGANNSLTLPLARNKHTATVSIALATGLNQITIADKNVAAETVTVNWEPGVAYAVPSTAPNTFAKSTVNPVRSDKLWAEADRIADKPEFAHLRVHVDKSLSGFDTLVTKINAAGETVEIERRHFELPRDGSTEYSTQVKLDAEACTIVVTAPGTTDTATIQVPAMTASFREANASETEQVEYDWGRVRGYFAMGMIFSKEREEFSKSDMFLDFTIDKTYLAKPFGPFKNFNTFFNARLTSIPVTATDEESEEPAPEPTPPCTTPVCDAFLKSRKAAMMQGGIYLPMYWDFTIWSRKVPRAGRIARSETNALFIAPLIKGGILTTTGQETSEGRQFGGDDVFNFYSFGYMIGHYRLHGRRTRGGFIPNTNVAPELISWLTLSYGRWENFEIETPSGLKDAMGNDILVRQRPYRIEALGRLKIPETPFIIGSDGNFGKGPDDVRFIFGTRFDIGKVLHTIRAAAARDDMGSSSPNP